MHYQRKLLRGSLTTTLQVNRGKICAEVGCEKEAYVKGFCKTHNRHRLKSGAFGSHRNKEAHPMYFTWMTNRRAERLAPEWLDFWCFAENVGERPSKRHILRTATEGLLGPFNFEWYEKLRQTPGEDANEWMARKWEDRKRRDPRWDHERNLLKKYGLTRDQYDQKVKFQDGKCAICKGSEKFKERKSDKARNLAVDHCHATGKVRELLCWRCNTTLGKVNESIELLEAMKVYLLRHLACEAA